MEVDGGGVEPLERPLHGGNNDGLVRLGEPVEAVDDGSIGVVRIARNQNAVEQNKQKIEIRDIFA